jgi:FKBP-type peptidyl-prolyl cis-trans isomerase FklB
VLEGDLDVIVHPNGFSYKLESSGSGARPDLYDQVSIIYTGKLLDGTVFADNITQVSCEYLQQQARKLHSWTWH